MKIVIKITFGVLLSSAVYLIFSNDAAASSATDQESAQAQKLLKTAEPIKSSDIELVFADYRKLLEKKVLYQRNDPGILKTKQAMLRKADLALKQDILSVTHKKRVPPSGDKHDYLSTAPYWWPNPEKENGLPYIRRDGHVNPATRGKYMDYQTKKKFFDCVNILGMAAFYTEDLRYAQKAVELLEVWFVNPKTRMNPNLEYAQGVPGLYDGRCFGIIEWLDIDKVIIPIQLLRGINAIPKETDQAIVLWFEQYLDWLLNSEKGKLEQSRQNNHGTWYDVQVTGILLFLDEKDQARQVLEKVKTRRIAAQIEPDGRQPHELKRTKSLSYSKMNLSAFKQLVLLGNKAGVDLWNYQTPDGRSIRKAEEFLAPYLCKKKKWPYKQLN